LFDANLGPATAAKAQAVVRILVAAHQGTCHHLPSQPTIQIFKMTVLIDFALGSGKFRGPAKIIQTPTVSHHFPFSAII